MFQEPQAQSSDFSRHFHCGRERVEREREKKRGKGKRWLCDETPVLVRSRSPQDLLCLNDPTVFWLALELQKFKLAIQKRNACGVFSGHACPEISK
jgi:hypothetical protein